MGKVEITAVDTAKLKTLSFEETDRLLRAVEKGDKTAREKLIKGNLRLVLSVVQRFSGRNEEPDDLFQIGCIGLIKAVDHFDCSQGVRFSTYAVPMILGEIRRYLRDNNALRVSRSLKDIAFHAMVAKEEMMRQCAKEPSVEEIAEKIGVDRKKVIMALDAVVEPLSLYEPVFTDNGDALFVVDQLGTVGNEDDWIDELSLKDAIRRLEPREKMILSKRFLNGATQTEVAEEIGISQAQISRLEKAALKKLKMG